MFQGNYYRFKLKNLFQNLFFFLSLITDLPLKTVANLNNYIIRNIIKQEQDPQEANNLHIVSSNSQYSTYKPSYSHEPITHLILTRKNNMYATSTDIPSVNDLIPTSECERCCRKSKSYIDSLKYELSKRIEFEATKGNSVVKFLVVYWHKVCS